LNTSGAAATSRGGSAGQRGKREASQAKGLILRGKWRLCPAGGPGERSDGPGREWEKRGRKDRGIPFASWKNVPACGDLWHLAVSGTTPPHEFRVSKHRTQKEKVVMKTNTKNTTNHGFTLIEMVGVLAVIAILAALLVPKIFAAINDSRYSSSVASINACKTATMDYFGKKGTFGAAGVATAFDSELVKENCLERPLACKVAETSAKAIVTPIVVADAPTGVGGAYTLTGVAADKITGSQVVEIELQGVAPSDALELSKRIDGADSGVALTTLTAADATLADVNGRVTYVASVAGAPVTVFIYIAHK
jgi:prepilin-type N-terminal cleavage/methylation domain-containing protein